MGCVVAGMIIIGIAVIGCWAACVASASCLMAVHLFLLVVLVVGETSLGTVGGLCPQLLGLQTDRDVMVERLQRNYGLPARDYYTNAVDLAQTLFECCGMSAGADYDNSFWRAREEETKRDWRVPISCCFLNNTNETNAFLNPKPMNDTLCQAKSNSKYQQGRHTKGCLDQLEVFFHDHWFWFLITGGSLVTVQLCVLISAIFLCVKRAKPRTLPSPHEYPDSQPRTAFHASDNPSSILNDEMYPTKRESSPVSIPLALMNEHVLNKNPYPNPKVYNNTQRIVDNLQKNFVSNGENNFYGQA